MLKDIFEEVKDNEVFLNCQLINNGSTISALTQSGIFIKIEPSINGNFNIFENTDEGWQYVHSGNADEIIDYINDGEEVNND
jgi:hypothetical protein